MRAQLALASIMLTLIATPVFGATAAQRCQAGKLKTAGKYDFCRLRAEAKAVQTGGPPEYSLCDAKFATKWSSTEDRGAGACPSNGDQAEIQQLIEEHTSDLAARIAGITRFVDNGDGTITDTRTGLQWEKKVNAPASVHDFSQRFTFDVGANSMANWVAQLNAAQFGGHNDWRIPTKDELLTILDRTDPDCGSGQVCIDPIFGPTLLPERVGAGVGWYWTATPLTWTGEVPNGASLAWAVSFADGGAGYAGTQDVGHVRAVRNAP